MADSQTVVLFPTSAHVMRAEKLLKRAAVACRLIPVPVDRERWDFGMVQGSPVQYLYLQPVHHNPTGQSMSPADREHLLNLAARHGTTVIEDGGDALLFRERSLLKDLPPDSVIHVGSFSKYILPGLRVGWVAGPEKIIRTLRSMKLITDLHSPVLLQAVLHTLLQDPDLPDRISRHAAGLEKLRLHAFQQARDLLPDEVNILTGKGSSTLFILLPEGLSSRALARDLARRGILVTPGFHFYPVHPSPEAIRLALGRADREIIYSGLDLMSGIIEDHLRASPPGSPGLPPL